MLESLSAQQEFKNIDFCNFSTSKKIEEFYLQIELERWNEIQYDQTYKVRDDLVTLKAKNKKPENDKNDPPKIQKILI